MTHEAVVLAGGLGTRLRSVVADLPKPMAPVAGRPFLEILLRHLARQGFVRVVLSIGYMADTIVRHFGDRFEGMTLHYEIEQDPLGTGGALRRALARCESEQAFVFNGDTFVQLEVDDLWTRYRQARHPIIVSRHVDDASRYDVLQVESGRIVRFLERGSVPAGLINAGCYVMPRDLFAGHEGPEKFSLEQAYLPQAVRQRRFDTFVTEGRFIDIGVPADFQRAQEMLADLA